MTADSPFSVAQEIVSQICDQNASYAEMEKYFGKTFGDGWSVFLIACKQVNDALYSAMQGGSPQEKNNEPLQPFRNQVGMKIQGIQKLALNGWKPSGEKSNSGEDRVEKIFINPADMNLAAEVISALYQKRMETDFSRFPTPILVSEEGDNPLLLYMIKTHFDKICQLEKIENGLVS